MALRKKKRRVRKPAAHVCGHCGEAIDVWPDLGGGEHQSYIEDCPVCCRPNRITAVLDESLRDFVVEITPEE